MILNQPITASTNPVTTVNAVYPIARQGDSGMEVICFAKRLLGIVPASDTYCAALAARVRGWQLARGLPVNGTLDEETLSSMGWSTEAVRMALEGP